MIIQVALLQWHPQVIIAFSVYTSMLLYVYIYLSSILLACQRLSTKFRQTYNETLNRKLIACMYNNIIMLQS
jgi:hypothetical protein